ncbi:MAG TPA: FGGY-family carbohydrate kinase, partial [Candidatus Marinimicrobia bacterium]|nr:FGGY-family carbohydrate kinase [Candidatus Neomarinimicrobiota bacterium]
QRQWRKEGENYTSSDLVKLAKQEPPLRSLIIPDDPQFLHQGNFPQMIANFCQITSQPMPTTPGAIVRCVLDSLALDYKNVLEKLVGISNRPVELIHIVGGGSQNDLLNQLTANATGLSVFAGPAEATVLGNAIVQLITLGEIKNLSEARQIVAKMRGIKRYEPKDSALWDEAYQRFLTLQKQF